MIVARVSFDRLTQEFADEWLRLERFEIIDMFTRTDEGDRTLRGSNARTIDSNFRSSKRETTYALRAPPPFGMAVKFSDDH